MGAGAKKGWAGGGGNIKEVGGARIILCMFFHIFARMKYTKVQHRVGSGHGLQFQAFKLIWESFRVEQDIVGVAGSVGVVVVF